MKLNKLIENIVKEIITESLDLSSKDSVITWMNKNAPEDMFTVDDELDWDYIDPMTGDDLETLMYSYMEKYKDVSSDYEIELYRLVELNTINDLDVKHVGIFWSFDENGVGSYGADKKRNAFVLTAIVKTKDINWEQGFYSFLSYGKSQFECYMNKGSHCTITHINDKELKTPIDGTC